LQQDRQTKPRGMNHKAKTQTNTDTLGIATHFGKLRTSRHETQQVSHDVRLNKDMHSPLGNVKI
jgi:hypothetical protein